MLFPCFIIIVIIFFYVYSITSVSKLLICCELILFCTNHIPQDPPIWCSIAQRIGGRPSCAEPSEYSPRDAAPLGLSCPGND